MKLGHVGDLRVLVHVPYARSTRKFLVTALPRAVQALTLV